MAKIQLSYTVETGFKGGGRGREEDRVGRLGEQGKLKRLEEEEEDQGGDLTCVTLLHSVVQ